MSYINQIPFQEEFHALYDHFRHSTFEFVNEEHSGPQTIQQYLSLHKSHWLLNVLRASEGFRQRGWKSLAHRLLSWVELRILHQYSRKDIQRYEEQALIELADPAFIIWPEPQATLRRAITEPIPHPLEREILNVGLANCDPNYKEQLHIMKVSYKNSSTRSSQNVQ